jgi:ABC-type nitrate/sulfonate/bicarbonate transport system substrate-binding protein
MSPIFPATRDCFRLSTGTAIFTGRQIEHFIYFNHPGFFFLWVAKDARIFDKHGIDATIIFISGSVRGIQAILAGEIAIGEGGGPGLAAARLAGGDVVAIAGNVNVLPYYLVSHPSIRKPEDLRGKIGGTHIAGTTAEFALKVGLKKIALDPLKAVNLRVIGGAIERMVALQKGIVQFTVVTEAGKAIAKSSAIPPSSTWSRCKYLSLRMVSTPRQN